MPGLLSLLKTYPHGRSLEQIHRMRGATFSPDARLGVLTELGDLQRAGLVQRTADGLWVCAARQDSSTAEVPGTPLTVDRHPGADGGNRIAAAPFRRATSPVSSADPVEDAGSDVPDPAALLRYWRSSLRSDPRGALTETPDRHGIVWHLITGEGPLVPDADQDLQLSFRSDHLQPGFREALRRREAEERVLAIGWPLALGRAKGVPVVWPVGLIAARWALEADELRLTISADDLLVNPDWLRGFVRSSSWTAEDLQSVFRGGEGVGHQFSEFLPRLRDAAARQIRGSLNGVVTTRTLDLDDTGLFDAAALFLPDENSFTSGASRELDRIAGWDAGKLASTALAPLLNLAETDPAPPHGAINTSALNNEQLQALRYSCSAPLTVVTGPPGTGKSEVIVSVVASVLLEGGSVLVASKNHQALDAVEDRLGAIAPDIDFHVRTLDPSRELDQGLVQVARRLNDISGPGSREPDPELLAQIRAISADRNAALSGAEAREVLQCELADLLERRLTSAEPMAARGAPERPTGIWQRLISFLKGTAAGTGPSDPDRRIAALRKELSQSPSFADPVVLTEDIAGRAKALLPRYLGAKSAMSSAARSDLGGLIADFEFAGRRDAVPLALTRQVLEHRPLWLVSVLGAARRVPLEPALFDLVVFDEASQCDIASALPLFARAKRAMVVGDSNQLTFIPSIGRDQDRNLMRTQGLPVARMSRYAQSSNSLFDFAKNVPGAKRVMLRSQYRSAAPIVDYISDEFYDGSLRAAGDPARLRPPPGQAPGIAWTDVRSPASISGNVNRAEVTAIAAHVADLLNVQGYGGSVGVATPFRAQAQEIDQAVRALVSVPRLELSAFRAATVDSFQGQERDLIIFSPVLGPASAETAVTFVQKDRRRMNVAISRARAVAHVFGDLNFARGARVRSLARLAAVATEPRQRSGEGVFDSHWERVLYHALIERGLKPQPQYEIAGRRLDFALFGAGEIRLDVEVDGRQWHEARDGGRKLPDLWRDHQMQSMGWRVRRFWVDELSENMEACLERIEQDLR
ncbi:AAA domain-containing protein [Falsigemmobacter faecalis]|uniref:DUF559 domain-containing protein n=1 Tax=Falsigemmobacter faecalis TaxID=2488730 RepID=A0A3P3D9N3_9RHOB|nr:AAA domain-containing protein [Falsigemmobacter faecalis]RRH70142.1 DUF559 domain-containing protein [Falsigemmobacter faecalis]